MAVYVAKNAYFDTINRIKINMVLPVVLELCYFFIILTDTWLGHVYLVCIHIVHISTFSKLLAY